MKKQLLILTVLASACVFFGGTALKADTMVTDGLASPPFSPGATVTNGTQYMTDVAGQPAPFNSFTPAGQNTQVSWSFSYTPPATITGATIELGLIYSPASTDTNPALSFTLDGTINLTSLLNTEMNTVQAPPFDDLYEVETVTIPSADLTALGTSPAAFALELQGPAQGKFGTVPDMQFAIVNSTLDLMSGTVGPPPPPVPEPGTFVLLGIGLAAIVAFAMNRRASPGL